MRHTGWRFYDNMNVHVFQHPKKRGVEKKLPKEWTGDLVGLMHNHKITFSQLAQKLGVTNRYVSMVLNGHRNPAGAEDRFRAAVNSLILENKKSSRQ